MVTAIPAARLSVFAYLCVLGSCSCSNGTVQGILGEGVSLSCMSTSCGLKRWRNDSMGDTSPFIKPAIHTSLQSDGDSYKLLIFKLNAYDVVSYSCWCNEINDSAYHICSDSPELICQAEVVVNNASRLHSSSRTNPFPIVTIDVNVKDRLKVKCPEGAIRNTNCYNAMERGSTQFTYNFKVLSKHQSCRIICQAQRESHVLCSIAFKIKVSRNKTSTPNSTASTTLLAVYPPVNETAFTKFSSENITLAPVYTTMKVDHKRNNNMNSGNDKPLSFPVVIGVCILIVIVVIVTFVVSFCIFSSSSKSRSQSTQNVDVVNPPTGANVPTGPTYATVNKSSNGSLKSDDRIKEPEVLSTGGLYSEVGGAGQEEPTTYQPNSRKAETSIINEYYSEVNKSDVKLKTMENGQEIDNTLYTEVNKEEMQSRQKECTSSRQQISVSVSDVPIYHVLEESNRSDHDTVELNVDDAPPSQFLYAIVNTDI